MNTDSLTTKGLPVMTYQSGQAVSVNYAKQAAFGTRADAAASREFPLNPGPGVKESRSIIQSNRIRSDGQASSFRHGFRESAGNYAADLLIGGHDDLLAGALRSAWATVAAITGLTLTIVGSAGTITRSTGSWISDGVTVGMVGRLGGFSSGPAANNDRNLAVVGLTATVLTVVPLSGGALVDASAIGSTTFTVAGRVARTGVTNSFFTFEETYQDIDGSLVFDDLAVKSLQGTIPAEGNIVMQFAMMGRLMEVLTGGGSPYFTGGGVVVPSGDPLIAADAKIFLDTGTTLYTLSSLSFTHDVNASGEKVIGDNKTPAMFFSNAKLTGSITALASDMALISKFASEAEFSLFAAVENPLVSPRPFVAFHLPRLKFTDFDKNMGNAGALTVTLPFQALTKEAASGHAKSMLNVQISNAS